MKTPIKNIISPKELICIVSGLVLASAIYVAMIHPSLQLFADLDKARHEQDQALQELDKTRAHQQELENRISAAKTRLAEVGGSPPMEYEKDALIARLTALATECGIVIDRYSPIDTIDESDYRAFFVQFTGRGKFTSLKSYFASVEDKMDYIDITHFSISSERKDPSLLSTVSWSCRINGMRISEPEPKQPQPLKTTITRLSTTEVVLHEP